MSEDDFGALRTRVEATAERLTAAQTDRRRRNQSLLDTLARLEEKFAAQEQELAYYRGRVAPLEAATAQLGALTTRLLDMVDAGFERLDDPADGVQQAIAVAAAMLEREAGSLAGALEADEGGDGSVLAGVEPAAEPAVDSGLAEAAGDGAGVPDLLALGDGFEDVTAEILAAEFAADQDVADMPDTVRAACNAAIVDALDAEPAPLPDPVPADDGPDAAAADGTGQDEVAASPAHPSADDIRALLQRVEAAAAQVTATRGESSEPQQPASRSGRSSGVAA